MSIPIEIEDITTPSGYNEEIKTYYSQWHILVSSNVRTNDLDTANEIADCLKNGFATAFRTRPAELFIVSKGAWDSETIDSMKIQMAAEIGEDAKGGRVHIHALVNVTHHGNLKINGQAIQVILREHCQSQFIKNIFVRVKWIPTSRPIEDYIGKNPLTHQSKEEDFRLPK
jgi:hypothetical protein